MNATTQEYRNNAPEIAAHADAALRAVRLVLGVLSCFVIGAYRPLAGRISWTSLITVLAAIITSVILLNQISKRAPRRAPWGAITQFLDVVASVALTVALDDPLGQQSWALLLVPVVSAAVRHGALASVMSWVGGSAGYIGAAFAGLVGAKDELALLVRVPGVLLAVAITVGLLARWMREGWEIQNALTETAATKEHRLAVIERTGHALKDLEPRAALELSADQTLSLGFDAASIDYVRADRPPYAVGQGELVSDTASNDLEPHDGPIVTVWVEDEAARIHSVSVPEPQTHAIVTGWSRNPIDEDKARAFATLIAQASTAIETATLLRQLRHTAAHDSLTGLANRRTLSHELEARSGQPGRLAVAFIDIDNFKQINDQHGHEVGDRTLIAIACRLEAAAGPTNIVARYGGDEFVILMPDATFADAQRVGVAVLRASEDPIALGTAPLHFSLSIGVAAATTPIAAADLIRAADQGLYQAKRAGKSAMVAVDVDANPGQPHPNIARRRELSVENPDFSTARHAEPSLTSDR